MDSVVFVDDIVGSLDAAVIVSLCCRALKPTARNVFLIVVLVTAFHAALIQ